jgi:hypothetical protein
MQLTCHVNQSESILRGIETHSTVKLEIDPSSLTSDQRQALADGFKDGVFGPPIPQPDISGLLEALDAISQANAQRLAQRAEIDAKGIAEARAMFAARETMSREVRMNAYPDGDSFATSTSVYGDKCERGHAMFTLLSPKAPGWPEAAVTEFRRLLATEEGAAWLAELDALNEAAEAAAKAAAIEDSKRTIAATKKRQAEESARTSSLRQWALEHGSDSLRLRTEEDIEWLKLAEKEWAIASLRSAGISDEPIFSDSAAWDTDEIEFEPTDANILALRRFRKALPDAEIKLVCFRYSDTAPCDCDQTQFDRPEVQVKIQVLGKPRVFYFDAGSHVDLPN